MHEHSVMPIEYALIAFLWGASWVAAVLAGLFVLALTREIFTKGKDKRTGPNERPFMCQEMQKACKKLRIP